MRHRALENTARSLSARAPIIATTCMLKLNLNPGFCLDRHGNLGTGIHQFGLGQHTSSTRKVLKDHTDQNQVISGGSTAPFLVDAATLMAPDEVSL